MAIGPSFFPPLGPATTQGPIDPQGWDRCVLADKVVPGFCRILRGETKYKEDPKPKNGADGSNPTSRGMDPQPLQLEITTFNDDDREQLAAMVISIVPKPGRPPVTVSIDHPSLRIIDISAVRITGAGALIPEPGTTKAKMVLDLKHALPSKKQDATSTAKAAPTRKVSNNRKKATPPTQQKGFAAPPASMGSG